jgi:histidyl-tRNA synthetase
MAVRFCGEIGLTSVTTQVNSTGCPACKPPYVEELIRFLRTRSDRLAEPDRDRMERNPLRVLDSKERATREALEGVPLLADYLCDGCRRHHEEFTGLLAAVGLTFTEQPLLVRGLDYYTRSVFELTSDSAPSVGTVLGGGRYDGLAQILEGPPTPAVGFAGGIERLILAVKAQEERPRLPRGADVFVAHVGAGTKEAAFSLAETLRKAGFATSVGLGDRGLKSQMKLAHRTGAVCSVIVGEGELAEGQVLVRDMRESRQEPVPLAEVRAHLAGRLKAPASGAGGGGAGSG